MNYLLDTCVICEMMKKRPDEKVVKWFCKQEQKTLYLSYLTIGEIQKGIVKRGEDARAKRLKTYALVLSTYGTNVIVSLPDFF